MFLQNKYTKLYYKIINNACGAVKESNDGKQVHHIIPRSLGGTDDSDNLVVLTYKQHRVVHRLLINMTEGQDMWKMKHAYKLFNREYDLTGTPFLEPMDSVKAKKGAQTRKSKGSYRTGKDNNFAKPEIIEMVRERMKSKNPMKDPKQKERMRNNNNNPYSKPVVVEGKEYPTLASAARAYNTTPHLLKRDYLNRDFQQR